MRSSAGSGILTLAKQSRGGGKLLAARLRSTPAILAERNTPFYAREISALQRGFGAAQIVRPPPREVGAQSDQKRFRFGGFSNRPRFSIRAGEFSLFWPMNSLFAGGKFPVLVEQGTCAQRTGIAARIEAIRRRNDRKSANFPVIFPVLRDLRRDCQGSKRPVGFYMLSGHSGRDHAVEAVRVGFNEFLKEPVFATAQR
jgi:hypothetical protein